MKYRLSSLLVGWIIGLLSSTLVRRRLQRLIMRYAPEHFRRQIEEKRLEMIRTVRRFSSDFKSSTPAKDQNRSQPLYLKNRDRTPGHRPRQPLK